MEVFSKNKEKKSFPIEAKLSLNLFLTHIQNQEKSSLKMRNIKENLKHISSKLKSCQNCYLAS